MPGSFEFLSKVRSACATNNKYAAEAAYHDYLKCHCYKPNRLYLYDSHLGKSHFIDVPCGYCYHCRETKVNSWVTRMYAHCEDFKHVYFVTLTYRGYNTLNPVSEYIMTRFADCCWHYDSMNSLHRFAWHPCLLVKKHYQDFMKRLRKNTGYNDISYVISGEYGKRYGRPHMHLILFSNNVITEQQIKDAWSVNLFYDTSSGVVSQYNGQSLKNGKKLHYLLGRVDYNDLVENGTFNTAQKIKIDGTDYSGDKCFAYVCKYVCKKDDYNKSRVDLAYHSLYCKRTYVRLFDSDIALENVKDYLSRLDISHLDYDIDLIKKQFSYEKIIPYVPPGYDYLFRVGLSSVRNCVSAGQKIVVDYFPKVLYDFCECFQPFVEFSRGTAIGSLYAKAHLSEFVTGVYNKPILQVKGFVVPTYFTRKTSEYLFGLRRLRSTLSGSSPYLGNLPLMRDYLAKVLSGEDSFGYCYTPSPEVETSKILFDSSKCLIEKSFDCTYRYLFPITDDGIYANAYRYDKKLRAYMLESSVPLTDFLRRQLYNINNIIKRHTKEVELSIMRKKAYKTAGRKLRYDLCIDTKASYYTFLRNQKKFLHDRQLDYDMLHDFVE